jgi:IS30 family transposase
MPSESERLTSAYIRKYPSLHSQAKLNAIARQLNVRPRKSPGYATECRKDLLNLKMVM